MIALAALMAALCWGLWQRSIATDNLSRALAAEALAANLKEAVKAHERASDALSDHLQRVEDQGAAWKDAAEALEKEVGVADDLSPYLRGVLDRVR